MFNFLKTENFNGKNQNRGIQMMKTTYEYCTYIGQFHAWDNYTSIGIKLS